jgi:hypothetical protein
VLLSNQKDVQRWLLKLKRTKYFYYEEYEVRIGWPKNLKMKQRARESF